MCNICFFVSALDTDQVPRWKFIHERTFLTCEQKIHICHDQHL